MFCNVYTASGIKYPYVPVLSCSCCGAVNMPDFDKP